MSAELKFKPDPIFSAFLVCYQTRSLLGIFVKLSCDLKSYLFECLDFCKPRNYCCSGYSEALIAFAAFMLDLLLDESSVPP